MTLIFNLSFAVIFITVILQALELFLTGKKIINTLINLLWAAGFIFLTFYIAQRWHLAQRPPFSNMFESIVLFGWALILSWLIFKFIYKIKIKGLGFVVSVLTLASIGGASLMDKSLKPLVPALQSNWLTIHVVTCFIGYAAFALSFAASCIFVFASKKPIAQTLDLISYKSIALGFIFLGLGIITGAVWANSAWGTYWSWDPKETWSLITWFIYAIYLHCRLMRGWSKITLAWISVIGFLAVIFTYFGVNYLLSGLHSYAK